jgi:lysozyme family protein
MAPRFEDLRAEYADLLRTADPKSSMVGAARATANKILGGRSRYEAVGRTTGVPWVAIGLIHAMESGCRFTTHLHNGDSLNARTRRVPRGRPRTGSPPFTWEESAVDAIRYDGLDKVSDWSPERLCYQLEKYNGWGYRLYHSSVKSPYLWSGTNHYVRGKYIADGRWSSSAVSGQTGAIAILKQLEQIDPAAAADFSVPAVSTPPLPEPKPDELEPESYEKAEEKPRLEAVRKSKTILGLLMAFLGTMISYLREGVQLLLEAAQHVTEWSPVQGLFASMGANVTSIGAGLAVAGICIALWRRMDAAAKGKVG